MTEHPEFDKWWSEEGEFIRAGGGQYEISFAFGAWQASRDRMIDECTKVCERIILEEGHSATGHGAYLCRKYIRALKSQQRESTADQNSALEASAAICQRRASEVLSNPAISADSRTAVHAALVCAAAEIAAIESQRSGNGGGA